MSSIADLIESHRESLVQRFLEEAGRLESARGLKGPEVINTFPEYLTVLAALSRQGPLEELARTKRRLEDMHVGGRLRLGYNQDEVTGEYVLMGRLIAGLWEALPTEQQPSPEDSQALFARLDAAMDYAVAVFTGYSMEDRQREKRTLRRLDALAPKALGRDESLASHLEPLVRLIHEALEADGAELFLVGTPGTLRLAAATGRCEAQSRRDVVVSLEGDGFLARVARSEEPLFLAGTAEATADMREGLCGGGLSTLMGLRLWPHGDLMGVLYVGVARARPFSPQAKRYMETLVEYLSGILDRAFLFGQLQEAHARLGESEALYRLATHAISDAIWDWDLSPGGVLRHEGVGTLFGYPRQEVESHLRWWVERIHPEDREAVEYSLQAAVQGEAERWESEYRFRHHDGHYVHVIDHGVIARDAAGRPVRMVGAMQDVTARKQVEETRALLLQSERQRTARLRGLASASVDITGRETLDAVLRAITERARVLIGAHWARTTLMSVGGWGKSLDAVSRSGTSAAPASASGIFLEVTRRNQTLRLSRAELEAHPRWKDQGAHGWLAAPLIGRDGSNIGVIQLADKQAGDFSEEDEAILVQLARLASVAVENVKLYTALRESEDRLRLALAAARLGTWDYDPVTGVLRWDERCKALFGLSPDAVVTWDAFVSGIHPEDRVRTQAVVRKALSGEDGGSYDIEYRTVGLEDGAERWVSAHGQAFFDEQGRAVRFIGTVLDVTERKRLDARLLRREEELQRRAEMEEKLIGIVSHDLRSPLNAIGFSTTLLLRRQDLDDAAKRNVERIRDATGRAERMIRDLLDFTQARMGGGIPIHRKPADLNALVRTVVEEVRLANPGRRIDVETSGSGAGDWDVDRLAQVLTNLLNNALRYGEQDTPVQVETRTEDGVVELRVHNEGEPIRPEVLPILFEPMRRGMGNGQPRSPGLGLGLYIVDRIVHMHGGRISVRSSAEEGTTFVVRLPRSAGQAGA
ncbi:PAS domain-containing protein [Pyxidicoccus fallax]|uniref:histidine kinase n=1 Tax=Pyxidicoccus fallax TaxID=394095 RepID=A0A848LJS8_9BACT|nr:PAS domain-containing protein [Pyxidicoccus fallax]NMO17981.1 PAS domain-containing protein [Pyxidicoccus fallax]NPC77542.1 PAS domain-containing protein [Pyxidicoccus fallax]